MKSENKIKSTIHDLDRCVYCFEVRNDVLDKLSFLFAFRIDCEFGCIDDLVENRNVDQEKRMV